MRDDLWLFQTGFGIVDIRKILQATLTTVPAKLAYGMVIKCVMLKMSTDFQYRSLKIRM